MWEVALVRMAGILKYLKSVSNSLLSLPNLPDPDGPLSRKIPTKAIELANVKVTGAKKIPRSCSPYLYLTPGQQYKVGKWAAEYGVTASLRYFACKYKDLPLTDTTVKCLKGLYKGTLKPKAKASKKTKCNDDDNELED